jgi:NADPH-dependent 7-cyano-7-deazaguanine reductase QueF
VFTILLGMTFQSLNILPITPRFDKSSPQNPTSNAKHQMTLNAFSGDNMAKKQFPQNHNNFFKKKLKTTPEQKLIGRILQFGSRRRRGRNSFSRRPRGRNSFFGGNNRNNDDDDLFGSGSRGSRNRNRMRDDDDSLFGGGRRGSDDDDSLFGNNNRNNGGGMFGNNNNDDDSLFGGSDNDDDDMFGNRNNNNNSGGLFGNNDDDDDMFGNNNRSNDMFGNNNRNNNDDDSLFGNNNRNNNDDDSLFGNNNNNNDDMFGNNNNDDDDLFGNNNNDDDDMFGNNNNDDDDMFGNNRNRNNGGGLFGNNNNNSNGGGLFGNNNNNSNGGGLFGNNNNDNSDMNDLFNSNNNNNNNDNGRGKGGATFSQGNNQFKIKMPTIHINTNNDKDSRKSSHKSDDMKSELWSILHKMEHLENKVNLALSKKACPMSPYERDLGFLSLQKMGVLTPSDSNTKLIYFNSQKRNASLKKALYKYIFKILSKTQKPKYLSFSLDMENTGNEFLRHLNPNKKYYGNKYMRAFQTMGIEQLQELPQNQYRHSSISPINLNQLFSKYSTKDFHLKPYPSDRQTSSLRKLFGELDDILDESSNSSMDSLDKYFVGLAN